MQLAAIFIQTKFILDCFTCLFLSGHQGQYLVLPDHRNEYGECHVPDLPETVPGTFWPISSEVRFIQSALKITCFLKLKLQLIFSAVVMSVLFACILFLCLQQVILCSSVSHLFLKPIPQIWSSNYNLQKLSGGFVWFIATGSWYTF